MNNLDKENSQSTLNVLEAIQVSFAVQKAMPIILPLGTVAKFYRSNVSLAVILHFWLCGQLLMSNYSIMSLLCSSVALFLAIRRYIIVRRVKNARFPPTEKEMAKWLNMECFRVIKHSKINLDFVFSAPDKMTLADRLLDQFNEHYQQDLETVSRKYLTQIY